MSEAAMRKGVRDTRRFYFLMAAGCLAVSVIGFLPTYFLPMARGTFQAEPLVHLHGLALFSWMILFFTQTWLVAQGKVLAHRNWGMLGIAIVTAIIFLGVALASLRIAQAELPGQPPGFAHAIRAFGWVNISSLLLIALLFLLAIVKLRDAGTHRRLMLLLTISMLGPAVARWFKTFLAPPPPSPVPGLPVINLPPVAFTVGPALVGDLVLLVAILFDWRSHGRVHQVYWIGGGAMLLLQVTVVPVSDSQAWQAIAHAIGHLAG